MSLDRLHVRGSEPFLKLVESIGKFPSLDSSWNETDFKLEDVLIKLAKHRKFFWLMSRLHYTLVYKCVQSHNLCGRLCDINFSSFKILSMLAVWKGEVKW